MKQNKDIRLGLRMSAKDMEYLDLAKEALGVNGRAEVVRMLVRMFIAPMQNTLRKKGITPHEAIEQLRIELGQ